MGSIKSNNPMLLKNRRRVQPKVGRRSCVAPKIPASGRSSPRGDARRGFDKGSPVFAPSLRCRAWLGECSDRGPAQETAPAAHRVGAPTTDHRHCRCLMKRASEGGGSRSERARWGSGGERRIACAIADVPPA